MKNKWWKEPIARFTTISGTPDGWDYATTTTKDTLKGGYTNLAYSKNFLEQKVKDSMLRFLPCHP